MPRFSFRNVGPRLALSILGAVSAFGSNLKGQLHFDPGAEDYRLLVKFQAAVQPELDAEGRLRLAGGLGKTSAALPELRYRSALDLPANGLGKAAGDPVIARFAGLMYVEASGASADKHALLALGERLESFDAVDYATLEPVKGPPPPVAVDIAPTTPLYASQQAWQDPAPTGVDCRYAWTRGAKGRGVRLHDIEDSWGALNHEDFETDSLAYARPAYTSTYDDHGIAVFGATFGQHNAYGIDGCAPEATGRAWSFQNSNGGQSRAATLVQMGAAAKAGDVILLEMQAGGLGGDNLAPADVDVAVWDATKAATDKGVVVIGTAGNGNANLDGSAYAAYRARGDNGVIMTGGGNSSTRARQVGSYGACCVHVQGWGHNVTTTGYSDLYRPNGDIRQSYTRQFSGTSSAGAVLAALAVSLQSHALTVLKRPLAPLEMRAILVATGTPQTGSTHIGPLPDLRKAILRVDSIAAASLPPDTQPADSPPGDTAVVDTSATSLRSAALNAPPLLKAFSLRAGSLEAEARSPAPFSLTLADAAGRVAWRATFAAGEGRVRVPMPRLRPGVYALTLRTQGGVHSRRAPLLP